MSEVYLAEQVSLQRQVALKVLRQDIAQRPGMGERFRREARLLSAVDHPSVVRVIDFHQSAELTFLVLEYAEGHTLEAVLQAGPLSPGRAVTLLRQLAEGLAVIHERGIVHRDLKPLNVVLSPSSLGEQARLLDFGIAKLAEPDEQQTGLSQPGQVVGTPAYLAPEQATGGALDARTDVYAFGVLAYQMLTGVLPFPGPSSLELMKQHLTMTPPPLEERQPVLQGSPALCRMVLRCLEKDPARRPANGGALWTELAKLTLPLDVAAVTPEQLIRRTPSGHTMVMASGWKLRARFWAARAGRALQAKAQALAPRLRRWGQVARRRVRRLRRLPPRWRSAGAASLLAASLAALLWSLIPPTATSRAEALLQAGHPHDALAVIDAALLTAQRDTGALYSLKAAALHQLRRCPEERQVLRQHGEEALLLGHPLLLRALVEDFARSEDDPALRSWLGTVPPDTLRDELMPLANGPLSEAQWGALRYLDLSTGADSVDRVGRYAASLEASQCTVRSAAARRLAELGDLAAIPSLRRLSETPREDWINNGADCGQDQAAEAIRMLKRRSPMGAR